MSKYQTQSLNRDGVTDLQLYLKKLFEKEGMSCRLLESEDRRFAPLLIARKEGLSQETITFVAHADMVSPNTDFIIDDNFLIGAGSADNRISLTMLVVLASLLNEELASHYSIEFVISPNEEMGSVGHLNHFRSLKKNSAFVFGMEPSPQTGSLIKSRNGNRWYQLEIEGVASHAGRLDDPSINAAHELFKKFSKIESIIENYNGIRLNFGAIQTPYQSFNTICGKVSSKIDFRFDCPIKRDQIHKQIEEVLNSSYTNCHQGSGGAKTSFTIEDDCPPMKASFLDITMKLFLSRQIGKYEKASAEFIHTGGAADINYFWTPHNLCLDGLGAVGGKLHTKDEFVALNSIAPRITILKNLISFIDKQRTVLC
jgi:glutamate carboxypeptidase